jgi:hypothetical protein
VQDQIAGRWVEPVFSQAAVGHVAFGVDAQDPFLVEALKQIAQTKDDDLMADDKHPLAAVMQAQGVERSPEPKDDVAPALAAGGPVVEFPEQCARFGLLGKPLPNASRRQAVEDGEFTLAKPSVRQKATARSLRPPARRIRSAV